MHWELLRLALGAVSGHRLRSLLSMLGIGIGIASVILLTSIGEGTRRFILGQFSQFGTNIIAINPGKAQTLGVPGVLGGTTHKLTFQDAEALARLPGVDAVMPISIGTAKVEADGRSRSVNVYGITPAVRQVWLFDVQSGSFWPDGDSLRSYPMAVLGPSLRRELFDDTNALGELVRIGGSRFRVVGLMEPKGSLLGIDLDDTAFIPVASAQRLFNRDELFEIDVIHGDAADSERVVEAVRTLLTERHEGNEDFTITTQAAMLDVFGNVMNVITMAVGAIAGISLLVGAIGILTMMWISVGERIHEIGLVRALGATRRQVRFLFLSEASLLAGVGGALGLGFGLGCCALLRALVPGLPIHTPLEFVVAALAVSLFTGLIAGALPAQRAAQLEPIEALHAE